MNLFKKNIAFLLALIVSVSFSYSMQNSNDGRRSEKRPAIRISSQSIVSPEAEAKKLRRAARERDDVTSLLESGVDANAPNRRGRTPLHDAAENGHLQTVRQLLQHEAAVGAQDEDGLTPLHLAALEGHAEVVEALLQAGAEINITNDDEETPLLLAVRRDQIDVVQLLLEHNADAAIEDESGSIPLHYVDNIEIGRLLVLRGNVDEPDDADQTPLHNAVMARNTAIVNLLLQHGANVNAYDDTAAGGHTPLHYAVMAGNTAMANLLLQHGANVNARDADSAGGRTPLHYAVAGHNPTLIIALLRQHADIHAEEYDGEEYGGLMPLDIALEDRWQEGIRVLIRNGARIGPDLYDQVEFNQIREAFRDEPLALAAVLGDLDEVINYLRPATTALEIQDAFVYAALRGYVHILQYLLNNNFGLSPYALVAVREALNIINNLPETEHERYREVLQLLGGRQLNLELEDRARAGARITLAHAPQVANIDEFDIRSLVDAVATELTREVARRGIIPL